MAPSCADPRSGPAGPSRLPVSIVGLVGGEPFGADARAALRGAQVLVGSPRHHRDLADAGAAEPSDGRGDRAGQVELVDLAGAIDLVIDVIEARREQGLQVCVLASGDPGFFGITRALAARLGPEVLVVHPAPSSVALAFARAGTSWDDAVVASAHGRPLGPAVDAVEAAAKAAVLTDPTNSPAALGAALAARGVARAVTVVSRIGTPDEAVVHTDVAGLAAGSFDPLSVVLLMAPDDLPPGAGAVTLRWGRSERDFAHRDAMITKAEVRAVALGKLGVPASGVLWDVGAGSGSVGIEAAALAPGLEVWAVERDRGAAALIAENAGTHGVDLRVVVGDAPDVLGDLPDPDRVFIGGGGIGVLDACRGRLRPGGTIVATYVLVDRALAARERLGNLIQVRVDRCVPLGSAGVRMEPLNPVFIAWGPA